MEKLQDKLARLGGLSQRPMPTPEPEKPRERLATFHVEIVPPRFALKSAHLTVNAYQTLFNNPGIHKPDISVYLFLVFNMNIKTGQSHQITRTEIMNGTGLSDQIVRRSLKKLTAEGLIKALKSGRGKDALLMFELLPN